MQKPLRDLHHIQTELFRKRRELPGRLAQEQGRDVLFITRSDSRINPNLLTQTKPAELFILGNAGNIVPPYGAVHGGEAAPIEFAVAGLGVKVVIVCGHSHRGATKGLLEPPSSRDCPAMTEWHAHAEATRCIVMKNPRTHPVVDSEIWTCKRHHAMVSKLSVRHGPRPSPSARTPDGPVNPGLHSRPSTGEIQQPSVCNEE